jgi:hypothetical protein
LRIFDSGFEDGVAEFHASDSKFGSAVAAAAMTRAQGFVFAGSDGVRGDTGRGARWHRVHRGPRQALQRATPLT